MNLSLFPTLAIVSLVTCLGLAPRAGLGAEAFDPKKPENAPLVRGAVYVASDAFNAPQMWKNFKLDETRRDFGYAKKINLNALRVWASYEYWQMAPEQFQRSFDQMLGAAQASGIRILISLFEQNGSQPTPENLWTTNPRDAFAIQSPGRAITLAGDQAAWEKPRAFVQWFMEHYRNDNRLLAIEVMNEPDINPRVVAFAKSMFSTAHSMRGSVALTIGSASVRAAQEFIPLGLDIIQYHDNFPQRVDEFEKTLERAVAVGRDRHLPVWITEWQRLRPSGTGWGKEQLPAGELFPDYASLAASVQKYPVGNFFWSLMIKRAYLKPQRDKGTVNGLFWPDGSVWRLADARAIAHNPGLQLPERPRLPEGFLAYLHESK